MPFPQESAGKQERIRKWRISGWVIWFGNGVSDLSFFQYFHAVGCEMRQKRRPSYSKHVPLIWKGSFLEQVEKENQGKTG